VLDCPGNASDDARVAHKTVMSVVGGYIADGVVGRRAFFASHEAKLAHQTIMSILASHHVKLADTEEDWGQIVLDGMAANDALLAMSCDDTNLYETLIGTDRMGDVTKALTLAGFEFDECGCWLIIYERANGPGKVST